MEKLTARKPPLLSVSAVPGAREATCRFSWSTVCVWFALMTACSQPRAVKRRRSQHVGPPAVKRALLPSAMRTYSSTN